MLRPQDTATRETKRLDGRWPFVLDPDGVGRSEEWFAGPLKDARVMPVPASFNDIAADASVHDYVGDVWYQRVVRVPRGWDGQRIVLHFESATHRATVWVGSTEVVSHEGGYTPFEGDVSAQVVAARRCWSRVCVNNTLSFADHPAWRHRGLAHGEEAAVLARLLQLRRAAPVGLAAGDSGG